MMAHAWQNDPSGSTPTDVLWRCAVCRAVVGFNRPGVGEPEQEPRATETEHPKNIDDYVGPCLPEPTPEELDRSAMAKVLAAAVDTDALFKAGRITKEERDAFERLAKRS